MRSIRSLSTFDSVLNTSTHTLNDVKICEGNRVIILIDTTTIRVTTWKLLSVRRRVQLSDSNVDYAIQAVSNALH